MGEAYGAQDEVGGPDNGPLELTTVDRIILGALKHRGEEGMTDEEIDAIEQWVHRAEIRRATLELLEMGRLVATVEPDGEVAFCAVEQPGGHDGAADIPEATRLNGGKQ